MIIMNLEIDNFFSFKDFSINFSYPKKIVNSYLEDEFLEGRENFRYKKVNIIMGSNATGKTSLGKMMNMIFALMHTKSIEIPVSKIFDKNKDASFSMDFVMPQNDKYFLYRINAKFVANKNQKYNSENTLISVKSTEIKKRDNYETCASRIDKMVEDAHNNYVVELEKIDGLSWFFSYPADSMPANYRITDNEKYIAVLEKVLKVLDPAIMSVEKVLGVDNTFVIHMRGNDILIKDGEILQKDILSSGTKAGIQIAEMVASIKVKDNDFYYCDEKFSYISTDIEKAILSTMISSLGMNKQLFFTTHNTDILDMPLPKHSFVFMKKVVYDDYQMITPIQADSYLKKNSDSLRNAFENDLFAAAPILDLIYDIDDI